MRTPGLVLVLRGGASSAGANESVAGNDSSDSGDNYQFPKTTNRAPSRRIERRADTSSAGADIPVLEIGRRIPPQASSTRTRPAGPWSRRAACRSCRVPRRVNASSSEGPGRQPQQAVGAAERIPPEAELPGATTEGRARQPNRRIEARAGNSPAARTVRSRQRRSAGRSDDLHARNGRFTWRSRQFSSSPCRFTVPDHPSSMRSFNPIITRCRRAAPAYARGSIGPACARIFIEHAVFHAQHRAWSAVLPCERPLACKAWHT